MANVAILTNIIIFSKLKKNNFWRISAIKINLEFHICLRLAFMRLFVADEIFDFFLIFSKEKNTQFTLKCKEIIFVKKYS